MKKRIVSMMLAAMVALSVVGCGSKTLSNDYVTVKQYKGLEVAQVEKVEVTDEQVEQSVQANLNAAAEKEPIKDCPHFSGRIKTSRVYPSGCPGQTTDPIRGSSPS